MEKFHFFCEENMLTIPCLTQKICLKEYPWKVERFVQKEDGLYQNEENTREMETILKSWYF